MASKEKDGLLTERISAGEKFRAYRHFLRLIWRANPRLAAFRFGLLVLGSFLQPLEVYVFSLLIAAIAANQGERIMPYVAIVLAAYGVRHFVVEATYSKMNDWFDRSSGFATQFSIFEHLSRLEPDTLSKPEVRRRLDYVREEIWRLNRLPDRTEWFMRSVLKLIGALGLAWVAPWWVSVLVILDAALQALNSYIESNSDLWVASFNSLEGRLFEYARYIFMMGDEFREIKLLGAAERILAKVHSSCGRILVKFRRAAFRSLARRMLFGIFHVGAYAVVIILLGREAMAGAAALSALYIGLNLFGLMGEALSGITGSLNQLSTDLGVLTHVYRLFKLPPEPNTGKRLPEHKLKIEFKGVSFRYPGAKREAVEGVNLVIREDEHLAVVGENGAGKSTFLRLLSGLDKPTAGEILINGIPLQDYRQKDWRRAFHLMLQNARLFQDFTEDNLRYGEPPHVWRKMAFGMERGLHISGADAVIRDLPEGLRTFIGTWAAPPDISPHQASGGQEQRLLIARTLIHGGRILGFDEPTSAMDALAETAFFDRLNQAMRGKGLIYISHRFSTVRRAERIIVFHEGKLVEQGSHEELMARHGKYAEMYSEQAKWYA
jgi:ABC-type multidrug transport system fused ATPase/permease subunit